MGDYRPRGEYYATKGDFEQLGCPAAWGGYLAGSWGRPVRPSSQM